MAIFKCKMCGGELNIADGATVAECGYCGTKQTLPKVDDERLANLYDRANHFRFNNDYDKAMGIYEKILEEDNTDPETYWSLVLCKYGIEYVEDPETHKRVPTVNRTQYTSIYDDENYKSAIDHADALQKTIYESEAETINEIQKGILSISQKEEPFDIFICYKETDERGTRTPDSVIAGELYQELTKEGFKVFFSRITLEDKLGTAYEPYIFAALNSAKVMIVMGTSAENFNSVWVKNEWSRYLALIKGGKGKVLIPAYRDMDPYDLPEEFSHLQAQDMSKLGFMQDLINGVKKIVGGTKGSGKINKIKAKREVNIDSILEKAFILLKEQKWEEADIHCEKVLDNDPENAEAYLGRLMAEMQVPERVQLPNYSDNLKKSENYAKALRFAEGELKKEIEEYPIEGLYRDAKRKMQQAKTEIEYLEASRIYEQITGYKDADSLRNQCQENAEKTKAEELEHKYLNAIKQMDAADCNAEYGLVIMRFQELSGYKESDSLIEQCREKIKEIKNQEIENKYLELIEEMKEAEASENEQWLNAIAGDFEKLSGYKDADSLKERCNNFIEAKKEDHYNNLIKEMNAAKEEKKCKEIAEEFNKISGYRDAATFREKCLEKVEILRKDAKYAEAKELIAEGGKNNYLAAIDILKKLGQDWRDSNALLSDAINKIEEEDRKRKKRTKIIILIAVIIVALVAGAIVMVIHNQKEKERQEQEREKQKQLEVYNKNVEMMEPYNEFVAENAKSIAVFGNEEIVGLKEDGTVVSEDEDLRVGKWKGIVAVDADYSHVIGLRKNGTVVAADDFAELNSYGNNYDYGQTEVDKWKDIIAISTSSGRTFGLKKDGTVVSTKVKYDYSDSYYSDEEIEEALDSDKNDEIEFQGEISTWKDIVSISAADYHVVGLKKDGTVVSTRNRVMHAAECIVGQTDVEDWQDIIAISAGPYHTVGLKKDGTVVSTKVDDKDYDYGQTAVGKWTDVIAISTGYDRTIGLRKDGTVVSTKIIKKENNMYETSDEGLKKVNKWTEIVAICAGPSTTIGLKKDGTVMDTHIGESQPFDGIMVRADYR